MAIRIVQVVVEMTPVTGNRPASTAAAAATSNAPPSQSKVPSAVDAVVVRGASTTRSALERAPVQRLKAGASRATENSTMAHAE